MKGVGRWGGAGERGQSGRKSTRVKERVGQRTAAATASLRVLLVSALSMCSRACACVHMSSCVCVRRLVQDVAAHNMIEAMPTFLFLKVHEFARVCARILWTCSHLGTSSLARCMRVVRVHMGVQGRGATLICIRELIGSRVQKPETYQIETNFVWHAILRP